MDKTDYEKMIDQLSGFPKFSLGQEVKTPDGTGIIVSLQMPANGLYLTWEVSEAVVWYSTEGAKDRGNGWVSKSYRLHELSQYPEQIFNQHTNG